MIFGYFRCEGIILIRVKWEDPWAIREGKSIDSSTCFWFALWANPYFRDLSCSCNEILSGLARNLRIITGFNWTLGLAEHQANIDHNWEIRAQSFLEFQVASWQGEHRKLNNLG